MDNGFNGLSSNGKKILHEIVVFSKNVATLIVHTWSPEKVYMVVYKSLKSLQQNQVEKYFCCLLFIVFIIHILLFLIYSISFLVILGALSINLWFSTF